MSEKSMNIKEKLLKPLEQQPNDKARMGRETLITLLTETESKIESLSQSLHAADKKVRKLTLDNEALIAGMSKVIHASPTNQSYTFVEYSKERMAAQGEIRDTRDRLNISALGLAGEMGEFVEFVKKHNYHDKEFPTERAIKELGDILWYVTYAADTLGSSLEEVARMNNEKLGERYPNGFNLEDASKRPIKEDEQMEYIEGGGSK